MLEFLNCYINMISWGQVRKERFCLSTDAFVCPVDKASAALACFMPT